MMRSPEISIPPMITSPNTRNWSEVARPSDLIIWFNPVRKNAAAKVDSGLASPPASDAPPMTTAAIGPRSYGEPMLTPGLRSSPARATPAIAYSTAATTYTKVWANVTRTPITWDEIGLAPTTWKRRPTEV